MAGIYVGDTVSGVKHLSSSSLELKADKTFRLIHSTTSFESVVPSTSIHELGGKFKKGADKLKLIPETKRVTWLNYGKNPDSLNINSGGARRTALVVIDTSYGKVQVIEEGGLIVLNITAKPNSSYLWNEQICYMKFIDSDGSNDLKNYCGEVRIAKGHDQ